MTAQHDAMTAAICVMFLLAWRLYVVCAKCDRAAYRWKWWRVKSSWGLLSFDLIACAVFFLMARSAGAVVGTSFAPARETAIQLVISGAAATGARGLTMPAFLKRVRGAVRVPETGVSPHVERETVNQYIERAIQQSCYSASQLWIMEKVVPHVLDHRLLGVFLSEAKNYLEGHEGPDAATDARWIDRLTNSTEGDSRKVASACGRLLARNGFSYLEAVIARRPEPGRPEPEEPQLPPMVLPGERHPNASPDPFRPPSDPAALHGEARNADDEVGGG